MSDPTYTLLNRTALQVGYDSPGYGDGACMPGLAILNDGTFFVAQWVEEVYSEGIVRMWHLAADLSVLGSLDVDYGGSTYPTVYAVAGTGMNVVLFVSLYQTYPARNVHFTYLVDCSGAVPAPGPAMLCVGIDPNWALWAIPPMSIRDEANDRIIVATYNYFRVSPDRISLFTYRLSTGEFLSWAAASDAATYDYCLGVFMDPADSTHFVLTSNRPKRFDFTISLDGGTTTYNGLGEAIVQPDSSHIYTGERWNYPQMAGSPFAPYGGGIGTEDYPDDHNIFYWIEGGVAVAQAAEAVGEYTNVPGTNDWLMGGRYAIQVQEGGMEPWPDTFQCRLLSWDLGQAPPVFERLDLPYFDLVTDDYRGAPYPDTVSWLNSGGSLAVDHYSGVILVSANIVTRRYLGPSTRYYVYTTLVWTIQGPSGGKPNLDGNLLGVDVRFS